MTPARLTVALVFPDVLEEVHLGKDPVLIPEGLRAMGHRVEIHCVEARVRPAGFEVVEASEARLGERDHWARRGLDAGIVFAWERRAPVLAALSAAGAVAIAKGDTDGNVTARHAPLGTLRRHAADEAGRARGVREWVRRLGRRAEEDARLFAASVAASDAYVVETHPARRHIATVLQRTGHADLAGRLTVIPNPVAPLFTRDLAPTDKQDLVVAIGRWESRRKNAPLLRASLQRFLERHPTYEACVIGSGARAFAGAHPRLTATGPLTPAQVAERLARARILVSSSRSEGSPVSANEALALGCSIVAPPLPGFRGIVELGAYGTLARHPGSRALAAALGREARCWSAGRRDPHAIAAAWRERVDVAAVASAFDHLIRRGAPPRGD